MVYVWDETGYLAYAAGFFDGEGCVAIARKNTGKSSPLYYQLWVGVVNTNPEPIKLFHEVFGGTVTNEKYPHRKRVYRWRASSDEAIDFLNTVYPYLVVKKSQADLAISFQYERTRRGKHHRTNEERARENSFYKRMKELNKGSDEF